MVYGLDENHEVYVAGQTLADLGAGGFEKLWSIDKRRVAWTEVQGGYLSTVFLVFDHGAMTGGLPVLFETMAFINGDEHDRCERCCTWNEAVKQHERIVKSIETEATR